MNNADKTKNKLQSCNSTVEKIYDGELISVVKYVISRKNTYECVLHPQAVTMVPLTKDGKLILEAVSILCRSNFTGISSWKYLSE